MKPYYKNSYNEAKFGDIWHFSGQDWVLIYIGIDLLTFVNKYAFTKTKRNNADFIEPDTLIEWR